MTKDPFRRSPPYSKVILLRHDLHTRRGGFQTHPDLAWRRIIRPCIWPNRDSQVSERIGLTILTTLPKSKGEGGFETRPYELN